MVLLDAGSPVNEKDEDERTELHLAALNDHHTLVALLCKNSPNLLDGKDSEGSTALHLAAKEGWSLAVQVLLEGGAKVREKDSDGRTALHLAAERGHMSVVEQLLVQESDTSNALRLNYHGRTALHLAAWSGHTDVVELLLEAGAISADKNYYGRTALHLAAWHGHTEVAKVLLAEGCRDISIVDEDGKTALHLAAENGHIEIVKAILEVDGGSLTRLDNYGLTALHGAALKQHTDIANFLSKARGIKPCACRDTASLVRNDHWASVCEATARPIDEIDLSGLSEDLPTVAMPDGRTDASTEDRIWHRQVIPSENIATRYEVRWDRPIARGAYAKVLEVYIPMYPLSKSFRHSIKHRTKYNVLNECSDPYRYMLSKWLARVRTPKPSFLQSKQSACRRNETPTS